MMVVENV